MTRWDIIFSPGGLNVPIHCADDVDSLVTHFSEIFGKNLKPLSVTTNIVGLQTDDADYVGLNSSSHVARVVGLQTDAVVITETRLSVLKWDFLSSHQRTV